MKSSFLKAAVIVAASLATAAPAFSQGRHKPAPRGERLYTVIEQHNPSRLSRAVRIANDSLRHGGHSAEILLGGRAILMVVPGFTDVQKEVQHITRSQRNLRIIACKETVDILRRSNQGRQPPFIAGVRVEPCQGRTRKNDAAGWQRMLGV